MSTQIEMVKKYLHLVQTFDFDDKTTSFILHKDYEQLEYPNALNKLGQKSNGPESFARMKTGRAMLTGQHYDITSILEQGTTVVIETVWSATMAIDAGPLKKGQNMKAFFCMFFDFKDGKIHRVRNYDCFEPIF